MKYLLKHRNNNSNSVNGINVLDCIGTLLNHFQEGKNAPNSYVVDLMYFDKIDLIIIKSMIKQIYEISPKSIIYIIGDIDFSFPNVQFVRSLVDVPS